MNIGIPSRHAVNVLGIVLALLAPSWAGPFYLPNEHPVTRLFGIPPAESGFVAERTFLLASLDIANNSTDDLAGGEVLMLDGETTVARLALRQGVAEKWELGVDIPYVRHAGGGLDGFIESYHDTFGFPQGNRKEIPADRLRYAYVRDLKTLLYVADAVDGPGDIRVSLGRQLYTAADRSRAVAARAAVEWPTGERADLLGSGSTDLSLSIAGTDTAWLHPLRLDVSLGVLVMTGGGLLEEWRETAAGFGSVTLGWPAGKRLVFKLQLDAHSPLFHGLEAGTLDDWACQAALGGTLRLPGTWALDIAVAEDAAVTTAPDVVFHLALSREW
ncbi:MAG: DUF3187 family protein [Verrucomicrobia bacterium]|nr:DUF3187 family protein [Verrucomicrobiota bacterium]MBU1909741.1 DUF3187 family protein [Verrucomicrobiota bacterium]